MPNILIDDQELATNHHVGTFVNTDLGPFLGGTASYFEKFENFTFNFTGVSISFYGQQEDTTSNSFQVVVDDGEPANVTFTASTAQLYVFYASHFLENSLHKVVFISLPRITIDYALVGVEDSTPLLGHNVIVGSNDPAIKYRGAWFKNSSVLLDSTSSFSRTPFGNSTAQTTDKSDSFEFEFYGRFHPSFLTIMIALNINFRSPAVDRAISEVRDLERFQDDTTSMTATVVAQEGDARSRAEHLRQLMVEIQRELAESDSVVNADV
ncbi:hypothetical protein DXG01_001468 [Tephrocybe rancida]|nr:hypothetical protein DXG01_001468 [Tephrocybe rancida]